MNNNKRLKQNTGFSLIELLLYIVIIVIILSALVPFTIDMTKASQKSNVHQDLATDSRLFVEKLKYYIRESKGINAGTSNFGVNLANNPANQLSLIGTSPADPIIITVTSGGLAQLKLGGESAVALNSGNTKVTSLIFTNHTTSDGLSENISFTITIQSNLQGNGQEYKFSMDSLGTVEVRTN